jgi:hypothetical protein
MCIATSRSVRLPTPARPLPPLLARAYRLTRYSAAGFEIRIGRRAPAALFEMLGSPQAALVTAWNPRSWRMPEGWNRRMQARLRERLRGALAMDGEGTLGPWHEAMLLVAGDPRRTIRLAAVFRQRAVVIVQRRRKAELRLVQYGRVV